MSYFFGEFLLLSGVVLMYLSVFEDVYIIMVNKVLWGVIFVGVVVVFVVQVFLIMLGVGIGFVMFDFGMGDNLVVLIFLIVVGIWYVFLGIIVLFVGGYIVVCMLGKMVLMIGVLYGLIIWVFMIFLVFYFFFIIIGSLVGGVFSGIFSVIGGVS